MEVIVNIHADPNDIPLVDTRSTVADVFAKQREAGWARRSDFDRKARIAALNRLREVPAAARDGHHRGSLCGFP